jgi:ABC-type dipeptide/oligopeptide/nickel transport system permease subunit
MNVSLAQVTTTKHRSPFAEALLQVSKNKLAMTSLVVLLIIVLLALFAPWLAPHNPDELNLVEAKLVPPFFSPGGNWVYPLGTDASGRDVLSRLLYGGRVSLFIGIVPVLLGCVLGIPLGLISGYLGGFIDEILMRINDILLAFPSILLALIVVAFLGQGLFNLMLAVGLANAPAFARIVRGAVLSERHKDYVASAVGLGATHARVLGRHVLPNIMNAVLVIMTLNFASALLEAAGLSFLGLGVKPPTAEWGAMLADGKNYFYDGWWMIFFPGVAIFLVVMSLNILGDALRDALDPRLKGR